MDRYTVYIIYSMLIKLAKADNITLVLKPPKTMPKRNSSPEETCVFFQPPLPTFSQQDFHLWKTSSCSGEATMTDEHLGAVRLLLTWEDLGQKCICFGIPFGYST